jgi:hypothetical protein
MYVDITKNDLPAEKITNIKPHEALKKNYTRREFDDLCQQFNIQERKNALIHLRQLYHSKCYDVKNTLDYMDSKYCEAGGWFGIRHTLEAITRIEGILNLILKTLSIEQDWTVPIPISLPESPKIPEVIETWVELRGICGEWSAEAAVANFKLSFNPNFIRQLVVQHANTLFEDCVRLKDKYIYEVKPDVFLDKLLLLRQIAKTKKVDRFDTDVLEQFIQHRKKKIPGYC